MISRLLGIIYLLMNKGIVKASELAEQFEVSVRTIYRDVEVLGMAGIPIYARKGKNGGICLTEQFVLNKMLISQEEQMQILTALASLEQTGAEKERETLDKLGTFFQLEAQDWVSIDFSDWSGNRKELFGQIKESILQHRVITFDYYGQNGEMTCRTVEPIQMVFKDYTWYISAFCRKRQAMRLFKILRIKRLEITEQEFKPTDKHHQESNTQGTWDQNTCEELITDIVAHIAASEAYRVYDRFEEEEITIQEDGSFLIHQRCIMDSWMYGMYLSFGPSAQILKPPHVRAVLADMLQEMCKQYHCSKKLEDSACNEM